MEIPGIGEKTASKLVTIGARLLDMWNAERQGRPAAEVERPEAAAGDPTPEPDAETSEPPAAPEESASSPEGADATGRE
jgi:hypothetical protein